MSGHDRTQQSQTLRGVTVGRFISALTVGAVLTLGQGCRTSDEDVQRWSNTAQGPRKLVAVLTHDKYPMDLRIEAAEALVSMKPRGGRRIGIQGNDEQEGLVDALAQMAPAARSALIAKLIPKLQAEMAKPPPVPAAGQPALADPSIPYKDAAFAILTHDDGALIPDEALKKSVRASLAQWCTTNFSERMDESSQLFGVEQMLRELKSDGVRTIPDLMTPGANKLDRMGDLVAELGDPDTKLRASQKLVGVAKDVSSDNWLKQKRPAVELANKQSKLNPTPDQLKAQLAQFQEEELLRVFGSMKKLGGKPVVDYLLGYVQDKNGLEKRRTAAMAALQGNLDRNNTAEAQVVLNIAGDASTPDSLRDVTLQRVGEFPRAMVVGKLYDLFRNENWKVRWVAASLVLKMSDASQVPEFMTKLGQADGLAITEPLSYGGLLSDLKGPPSPASLAERYAITIPMAPALTYQKSRPLKETVQRRPNAKPTPRNVNGNARCRARPAKRPKRSRRSANSWNSASSRRCKKEPKGARSRRAAPLTSRAGTRSSRLTQDSTHDFGSEQEDDALLSMSRSAVAKIRTDGARARVLGRLSDQRLDEAVRAATRLRRVGHRRAVHTRTAGERATAAYAIEPKRIGAARPHASSAATPGCTAAHGSQRSATTATPGRAQCGAGSSGTAAPPRGAPPGAGPPPPPACCSHREATPTPPSCAAGAAATRWLGWAQSARTPAPRVLAQHSAAARRRKARRTTDPHDFSREPAARHADHQLPR